METLKNTVRSIICSILIASLSIPIVYAFDGIVGGGLAQVGRDLKHLIPEKKETNTAISEEKKQKNGGNSTTPQQPISGSAEKPGTHNKFFTHML